MRSITSHLFLLAILTGAFSCQTRNEEDRTQDRVDKMIELNSYYHFRYGTIHVNFLREDGIVRSIQCRRGKVRLYDEGQLMTFVLSSDHNIRNDLIPSGSRMTLYRNGNPEYIGLPENTNIQGHLVSGNRWMPFHPAHFYENGGLWNFRAADDLDVNGIPCSNQKDIGLYPDGRLLTCQLSETMRTDSGSYDEGAQVIMDEKGAMHPYADDLYTVINRRIADEFLLGSVTEAFMLRLDGRTDSAMNMLFQLKEWHPESPLLNHEMAIVKWQEYLGGTRETIGSIMWFTGEAIRNDPSNLAYAFFDAECGLFAACELMKQDTMKAAWCARRAIDGYERVLVMKPDHLAARLSLVEAYVSLPGTIGGNRQKAESHAQELKKFDTVWAAMAEAIRLDPEYGQAVPWFMRYMVFMAARKEQPEVDWVAVAGDLSATYLGTEPSDPLKAFTIGCLSRIIRISGDEVKADELWQEAMALDPHTPEYPMDPPVELFTPLAL